ncbi:MAG: diacylglycerol kinase family protein [Patescibacteria group bacterium]|nr:diacylglycerol kinase family protein [Patescibacteria group bacterium]
MVHKNRNFVFSVKNALDGLRYAFITQRNFKLLILITFLVFLAAYFFEFSLTKWLILIFLCCFILVLEIVNTIIETIIDHIFEDKIDAHAKVIKDLAAGMVLLASIFSLVIGFLIFFT